MTDLNNFIYSHSNEAMNRNELFVYIPSLAIPPRSPIRKQLVDDGWKLKSKFSRLLPFSCFVMSFSQFSTKHPYPSPDQAEDSVLINLYYRSDDD